MWEKPLQLRFSQLAIARPVDTLYNGKSHHIRRHKTIKTVISKRHLTTLWIIYQRFNMRLSIKIIEGDGFIAY